MIFSAALLAGGRSSRMGRDKAFLEIDGIPLWQRQVQLLRKLNPAEIFIAGPAQPEWIRNGLEVVADAARDSGPLGGLVAVLRRCRNPQLLVLAVDLPNMTSEFLRRLLAMCPENSGIVPKRECATQEKRFEPLTAIYPATALALAENCLSAGEYSLQRFTDRATSMGLMATKQILEAEESLFFNLNTPADFAGLEKK
jgi:molybdenum cofactor guanylyltransferase